MPGGSGIRPWCRPGRLGMRQAALALLAIGIVGGSGAGPVWAEGAREAIAAADRTFAEAFNHGDAATVAKLYTTDAAVLPPGDPRVDGREGIQDYWQAAIDAGVKDLAL